MDVSIRLRRPDDEPPPAHYLDDDQGHCDKSADERHVRNEQQLDEAEA